jgi:RHS repeat-associated protein
VTAGATSATESFSYDGLGQEVLRQGEDIDVATGYDPMGHTAEVDDRSPADDDVATVSDGTGRLVSRTEPGAGPDRPGTTLYFYWGPGATLAEETDGAGNTLVRYACAASGAALAQQSYRIVDGAADPSDAEGTWRWLLSDADANVATVVGGDGAVVEQKAFDPYGKPQATGSTTTDPRASSSTLGFQGAITDAATGSVVLGPRRYDPSTARFSTADSYVSGGLDLGLALDPLTGNRYLFAGANPVAFYDDGHAPLPAGTAWDRFGHQIYRDRQAEAIARELDRPVSVGRRKPTKDGFCGGDVLKIAFVSIGRRNDGRCAGNNKFFDFLLGSDSEKEAIDASYNNPFLNGNQAAAEQIRKYGPSCGRGLIQGALVASPGGPWSALGGGVAGCGTELGVKVLEDIDPDLSRIVSKVLNARDLLKFFQTLGESLSKGVLRENWS